MPTVQSKVKLKATPGHVIVKRDAAEEKSKEGIILPDSAQEKGWKGTVIDHFQGRDFDLKDGLKLVEGDRIIFDRYAGREFKFEDEVYLVMHESDVMATLEEPK